MQAGTGFLQSESVLTNTLSTGWAAARQTQGPLPPGVMSGGASEQQVSALRTQPQTHLNEGGLAAHHNRRCSWGLKPPVSRSDLAT